jgi:putative ABC transport system ATP-binding protein
MHKIKQDYNTTFVFATHDEKIVSSAERLITLVDGQITEDKRIV